LGIGDGDALLAFGKVVPVHLDWRKAWWYHGRAEGATDEDGGG
jgi:hypothetical protein